MNSKYEDTIKKNGEDRTERNVKSSAVSIETMNFDAAQSEIDAVQRAALSALAIEGAAGRGVSIVLTDDETIHVYNREYRDVDRATDVLSFPMMEYDTPGGFEGQAFENSMTISPESEELVLGDIVLCSDVIAEQAEEYGHSELREYSFLIVHSMLHLFGYDHMEEEERKQMEAKQREIMEQMGILRESN